MRVDNKIEFRIGKTWYKVKPFLTLGDWQELVKIQNLDRVGGKIEWVSLISGCPEEELKSISHSQFTQIFNETQALLVPSDSKVFHQSIEIDGELYAFVDMDSITTAEFADLDVISVDPMRDQRLHEMLAILYRPAKKLGARYLLEPYDHKVCAQRADKFKELPMEVAVGAGNFFFEFGRVSIKSTLDYLKQEMPKGVEINLAGIESLLLPEIGTISSWSSQEKILSDWTEQLHSQLRELLTTLPGSKTEQTRPEWLQKIFKETKK